MAIDDYIMSIKKAKQDIANALNTKGVPVGTTTPLTKYAEKVSKLDVGTDSTTLIKNWKVKQAIIPKSKTSIKSKEFNGCTSLKSLTVP